MSGPTSARRSDLPSSSRAASVTPRFMAHIIARTGQLDIPTPVVTELILRTLFNEDQVSPRRFVDFIRLELNVLDCLLENMQDGYHDKAHQ